ncbi:MAG TPA: hypothetical protein VK666_13865 [Chryseolinea sp.]|nr:hypothetical protein [Chryseolinea sp.]
MKKNNKIALTIALMLVAVAVQAQSEVQMADQMRANGKIFVVVAIILVVLGGLIAYLLLLDKKVKKLENLLSGKKPITK